MLSGDFKIGVAGTYVRLVCLSFPLIFDRTGEIVGKFNSHDSIEYFNGFDTSGLLGSVDH